MSVEEILLDAEERMEKALGKLKQDLTGIRTGRANPGMVDSLARRGLRFARADQADRERQRARAAAARDPPVRSGTIKDIEKGIIASDLGLAPQSDGKVIRLNIPPLSGEVRRKMVARTKELTEETKVAIRNIRRDANKQADQEEKDKALIRGRCAIHEGRSPRPGEEVRGQVQRPGQGQRSRGDERLAVRRTVSVILREPSDRRISFAASSRIENEPRAEGRFFKSWNSFQNDVFLTQRQHLATRLLPVWPAFGHFAAVHLPKEFRKILRGAEHPTCDLRNSERFRKPGPDHNVKGFDSCLTTLLFPRPSATLAPHRGPLFPRRIGWRLHLLAGEARNRHRDRIV